MLTGGKRMNLEYGNQNNRFLTHGENHESQNDFALKPSGTKGLFY